MTLAEKIAALRGARRLSQGDLAERLDVSRQSVSKWETGQSVPELDKLIRLADLFGVTVDELVRDGDAPAPKPEAAPPPETKIVYVGWRFDGGLTATRALGIICAVGGIALGFLGDLEMGAIGAAMLIAGLILMLVKKHPLLTAGWVIWAVGYLFLCNPAITGAQWQPFWGVWAWCPLGGEDYMPPVIWLMWLAYIGESVLTIALPLYTGRLCWKGWGAKGQAA